MGLFVARGDPPVLSINRGFSAPITLETDRSAADLAFLSANDPDPFARYEAMQQLMLDTLIAGVTTGTIETQAVVAAVRNTLTDPALDAAFVGEAVLLPSEAFIAEQLGEVDPDAIAKVRESLRRALSTELADLWQDAYARNRANRYEYTPTAKGARRLRSVALGYIALSGAEDWAKLAHDQYSQADNMTDRIGALGTPPRGDTGAAVEARARHPDFTSANPNRLRSLVGAFAVNQRAFHDASGRGYRFVADMVLAVDKLNPQAAARLIPSLGRWRKFEPKRQALMQAELRRILEAPGLSKDVFEQVSKSLG